MGLKKATEIKGVPFRGGAITVREKALIPFGGYSMIQNIRSRHPGFIQRPGQLRLHVTADSTNSVMSLYQFNKSRVSENHFYAQFSDSDVLEADTDPPGVDSGVFGAEVFDGTASPWPASWGNLNDMLMFSNGVDQHQLYAGTLNYVSQFVKYDGAAAPPNVPELGFDYSEEVTDGLTTTVAVLDSLDTYANNECLFIRTPVPANRLGWTIEKPNGTTSVVTLYYRKNDGTWADASQTDGTLDSGATLGVDGSMTWTHPTDEVSSYMYGASGFWYQLRFSAQLDAEVEVSKVTYQSAFQDLRNVWNGIPSYAVEVQVEGTTQYSLYGAASVDVDALTNGKKIMIASSYPIEAVYIDPGETPNATGTALTSFKYWDGDSFEDVGTKVDGTSGMSNPGWVTFPRKTDVQPHQFGGSSIYAYWYEMIWDTTISDDVTVSIEVMPFFEIGDFGPAGQTNCVWKDRGVFTFNLWPAYLYVAASGNITALNGTDYGILKAGDGRANKCVAMEKFHNELLVWQEEKGVEGGCTTLFEGYTPTTFGKLLLSAKIGTMNAKTTAVVDGVMTSTATDEVIKTLAFFLSRYGVCATDGRTITIISDDIGNYFDPTHADCIRRGYEQDMWLSHDSAFNIIRIGLVAGSYCTETDIAFADSDPDTITTTAGDFVAAGIKVGAKITTSSSTNTSTYTVATVTATTITLIAGDSLSVEAAGSFTIYPASPNVFPIFDLTDKAWGFDNPAQTLGCMTEVEALSGSVPVIQVGGGIGDGFVYQLNTGTDDVSTAIDSYAEMELDANGEYFNLSRLLLRCKAQTGNIELTINQNELTTAVASKELSMAAERTGQTIRRHLIKLNLTDQHLSVKIQQDTAAQEMSLLDIGFDVAIWENR